MDERMQPMERTGGDAVLGDGRRALGAALLLLAASLAFHLLYAGATELSPQEAYYWLWSRHLDLSYFDHPPLAAWTIHATTALLGDTERGVRAAASLHALLFGVFFFLAGRRLFGPRIALLALALGLATPLFALGQVVITPDAPLLAGWAAALYFTVVALQTGRAPWLLAAGAAVGFAAVGKYTGWILAPQILLALLLDARGRRMLLGPWPYLAVALAVAVFSPVLIWNARHGWVSFGFQFGGGARTIDPFRIDRVGRFVGLQSLTLTPVLWIAAIAAAIGAARRWREPAQRICAIFSLPLLAIFTVLSPFVWVKGNWAAAVYPTALLAAVALYDGARAAHRRVAAAAVALALVGTVYLHLAMVIPALPFSSRDDTTRGWRALAARVDAERGRLPADAFVLGCGYKPAAELAFYDRAETWSAAAMGEQGLQFGLWQDARALEGKEGLLVLDRREKQWCAPREQYCRPLEPLEPLEVRRGASRVTTFDLWRCRFERPAGATARAR